MADERLTDAERYRKSPLISQIVDSEGNACFAIFARLDETGKIRFCLMTDEDQVYAIFKPDHIARFARSLLIACGERV